jgi:hypothetical protein
MLRHIPFISNFIRAFIIKLFWILLNAFSPSIEMIKWILSLLLLMCCITFNDLHMLNYPYIPGMKLTRSWCRILLICYWIFCHYFIEDFSSIFIEEIGLQFSYLHVSLSGFWSQQTSCCSVQTFPSLMFHAEVWLLGVLLEAGMCSFLRLPFF